uniref:Uncharacterized protein n=1 Tax=Oryza sativa subsp. japonica TaxID=39947 RepID=Q5Z5Q2_ORYSJ|nr:hypothetical protein [Oryza sativa Japonica Group]
MTLASERGDRCRAVVVVTRRLVGVDAQRERERERERLAARNGGSGFGRASSGCGGSLSRAASAFTWLLPGGSGLVGLEMTTSVSHANYSIKCSQGEEMKRRSAESLGNFSE